MDTLKSIWQDLSDRLKSPFLIAFVVTWSLWNWLLLYAVSNFDAGSTLDFKLNYIKNYFAGHHLEISIYPFVTAFFGTLFFYGTKLAYLWIDTNYENKWRINVIKSVGLSSMVPQEDLIVLHKEIDFLKGQLDAKVNEASTSSSVISRLQEENATVEQLKLQIRNRDARVDSLNRELDSMTAIKAEITFPNSLDRFFPGTWICEYHLIDQKNPTIPDFGYEKFSIKKEDYTIEGKTSFLIESVKFYDSIQCLTFHKNKFDKIQFKSVVKIFRVEGNNLWIGHEMTGDKRLSYLRFYPVGEIPLHMSVVLPHKANSDRKLLQLYLNNFDTVSSYLQKLRDTGDDKISEQSNPIRSIAVHKATYGADGDFVDVTKKISQYVADGILEFEVGNWLVENRVEPAMTKEKNLEVTCNVDGIMRVIVARERTIFKFRE